MKFVNRLGYYLGGFSIGLIILFFFLNGKDASCSYGPNARTVKNISSKPIHYSAKALQYTKEHTIDSTAIVNLIKYGDVDFSLSDTKTKACKTYHINNTYKQKPLVLKIMNCDSIATLKDIYYTE